MIWSYTFLNTYWSCPRQAYHKYVAKDLPRVESEAMRWGNQVHTAMEKRLNDGQPLPEHMQKWEVLVRPFADMNARAETKMGVTAQGEPTGFFDKNCYGRGVIDALVMHPTAAFIGDWKTGKRREDPAELQIFALLLKAKYPTLEKIVGRYFWLQTGEMGDEHDLSATPAATWSRIAQTMQEIDTLTRAGGIWPARKNGLCREWCDVRSCEHNGRRG